MTRQEIIERGINAKQLMDAPFFKDTITALQKNALDQLIHTNLSDKEGREELHAIMFNWTHCMAQLDQWHKAAVYEQTLVDDELDQ